MKSDKSLTLRTHREFAESIFVTRTSAGIIAVQLAAREARLRMRCEIQRLLAFFNTLAIQAMLLSQRVSVVSSLPMPM